MKRTLQRLVVEHLEDRTLLSACDVTRLTDNGVGTDFRGDLRYCINKVQAEPGPDNITFAVVGTINLTRALPFLTSDIDFLGTGAEWLTIRRDTGGLYRIISVKKGATVNITGLTISNGMINRNGFGGRGGGIWNGGNLTLQGAVVSGNTVEGFSGDVHGGGIFNSGKLTLIGSSVEGNFVRSSPQWFGGAGAGGGIFNSGELTAIDSTIAHNSALESYAPPDEGNVYGGGIFNTSSGTVSLDRCSVSFNVAISRWWAAFGGGIDNHGRLVITNSTLTGNRAVGILSVGGGAIDSNGSRASTIIRHSTITDNETIEQWVQTGYLAAVNWVGVMDIQNSIISNNLGPAVSGVLTSSGHNLFSNSSGGSGYAPTDILDVDPRLGPLTDNGGPTLSIALFPGSPAIDAGNNSGAPEFDQRGPGFARVVNGTVDIGAYEVQGTGAPSFSRPRQLAHNDVLFLVTADLDVFK